jgi:DNA-binding SARP family transcriptional activator
MEDSTQASLIGRLTVMQGQARGQTFTVERFPVFIGRGEDCEVCLEDAPGHVTLSRRHARLTVAGGRLRLEDLSTNGTTVGNRLLNSGEQRVLSDCEQVWFGPNTQVKVETLRAGSAPALAAASALPDEGVPGEGLRLQTLGGFRASWGTRAIPEQAWETRKPILLVAYLAWHNGRVVAAERLCSDLWPDHAQGGRQALQSTLARVRRALRPSDPVTFERGAYRLHASLNLDFDVARLQEAAREAAGTSESTRLDCLQRVRSLYQGPFLEGFTDDWACLRRQDLEQQYLECMADLGHLLSQQGQQREAVELLREVLQLEPCWEPGHQGIVEGLVRLGQRDEAVRHYHRYVQTLKSQLSLSPSPEMLRLYYALLDAP